ncbi:hypothetical protein ACOMHN_061263 [Nucella lapillus]
MDITQIRILRLKKGNDRKYECFRLQKGQVLRFLQDSCLQNQSVRLFTNHPLTPTTPFHRNTYHELMWRCSTKMRLASTDLFAEIPVSHSGSFNYYFTLDDSATQLQADGKGYFVVDPTLQAGGQPMALDGICMQTVVTKLLGPFEEWESRLRISKESAYNMVHFTPVQELGESNSAYSIRDHHRLSPAYSTDRRLIHLMMPHLKNLVDRMEHDWQMLSIVDVVLNHTATDSPLLERHPECAYNLENCPHLRPAYMLDRILQQFSLEVAANCWEHRGIPARLEHSSHLDAIRHVLHCEVLPKHRLGDFYQCSVDRVVEECKHLAVAGKYKMPSSDDELVLQQDPEFRRLRSTVDISMAVKLMEKWGIFDNVDKASEQLRQYVVFVNQEKEKAVWEHLHVAIENFIANARHRFVDEQGDRLGCVTAECPIMPHYFKCPESHKESVEKAEVLMNREPQLIMAVNGYVLTDQPFRHFEKESNVYLRRELVSWGDTIKLRYGQKPEDCPVLWDYIQTYIEMSAQVFHGFRIDNAHGIPLHVMEYMMDVARRHRPELYILAELFTGDSNMDQYFTNRLGINALIRDMETAKNPGDMRRLVANFSAEPLGSFEQPRVRTTLPSGAPTMFFDMTHDNDSPIVKRSEYTVWPSSAVTAMSRCAIGSNRGYDELVPDKICVVSESRPYQRWVRGSNSGGDGEGIDISAGMLRGKQALNLLHRHMAQEGYTEIHTEDLHHGVVQIIRHNPVTRQSVILVVSLVFQGPPDPNLKLFCSPLHVEGVVDEVIFEGNLVRNNWKDFSKSESEINGLPNFFMELREQIHISRSHYCKEGRSEDGDSVKVFFSNFTPGTVVALQCSISDRANRAVDKIDRGLTQYANMIRSYTGLARYNGTWEGSTFRTITSQLSTSDLNRVLYRVGVEEESDGFGVSSYDIPNYGPLCYCGLRGVMSVLGEVRPTNNTGHPLCENLRQGPWLMDYIVARLRMTASTKPLGDWLEGLFDQVKEIPRFMVPCFFDNIISSTYIVLREQALHKLSPFVRDGSTFVQALALSYTQFLGYVRTARLPPLSPHLCPAPRSETFLITGEKEQAPVSLASGLPYFAADKWRCWGRGTFIALRGMLLITGRFSDARCLILAYAGTLRHGLIPNLLEEGKEARYNCRDAVWWWLHAIKAYTLMAPDGESILKEPVLRLYPTDDAPFSPKGYCDQPLHAVMQEALSRHMAGIHFREFGAGPDLDPYMTDEGFNVDIGVRWPEGYVYGGNVHNCGTWMDFMGKSHAASNWGKPATPRDGSAVEIVGLCMATLSWLAELSQRDVYPYTGVRRSTEDYKDKEITFEEWSENIKAHFERDFYVSPTPNPSREPQGHHVTRRGIYKDCANSSLPWTEYQLRPNICVAMVVAPKLFEEEKAWGALEVVQQVLLGPVGMKTLDPKDHHYCGYYSVSGDYNNPIVAAGYNYHNGPEHIWLIAYFLRAKLHFASCLEQKHQKQQQEQQEREELEQRQTQQPEEWQQEQQQHRGVMKETVALVKTVLCHHYQMLFDSPWKALPQLTNENGTFCEDSCRAQATSSACVLELLFDLERLMASANPASVDLQGPVCLGDCGLP